VIEEISIRDLGVIGEARLPLGPGFTALTGETGAGKTMIVTALGLLRGERADSSAVRSGRPQAIVEGSWRVPDAGPVAERVAEAGGELEPLPDGTAVLILGRTLSSEGRGRALVGGRTAPVGVLGELGERLVAVHGQSDQVRLKSATAQREALDRFGGAGLSGVLSEYAEVYRRWQDKQSQLANLVESRERRLAEADSLRAALADIEAVDPQRGEDSELAERAERLTNLEDLRLAAAQAQELISSQSLDDVPDVTALLEGARRALDRASAHDAELVPIVEAITAASFAVSEISGSLASYLSGLDTDGTRELEGVQERRADLSALLRKYGPTLDDVLDFLDRGSGRLLELDTDSDRIEALTAEVEEDGAAARELADRLSGLRKSAAAELGERVTAELAALAMPNARLTVEVTERDELSASGRNGVGILLQPHSGTDPRPIGRGASGGELSRVMLALEVVLAGSDPVPTFIFDEVDAGVGGASATEIGRRLARLAETAQVIVVTHLAQVAAFATNHLRVVKDAEGAVTESSVQQLTGEARVAEMARLLSGLPDSESGLAHARELLDAARTAVKVGR
jgi:DNA repair protein RecN (Recombination protein N)